MIDPSDLSEIWKDTIGDPGILIAILDAPVDLQSSSLRGAALGELLLSASADCSVDTHGTELASLVFGQHGSDVNGVSPGCSGLSIPIFSRRPLECSQIELAQAMLLARDRGAHVINVSAGQISSSGAAHPILADAVRTCIESNILIVSAVGNDGCNCVRIPSQLPLVLAVAAAGRNGRPLASNNWSDAYKGQSLTAPGERIAVAGQAGGIVSRTGSSYATAYVSGIAALLLSIEVANGRKPNPLGVRRALIDTAIPGSPHNAESDCQDMFYCAVNPMAALDFLLKRGGKVNMSFGGSDEGGSATELEQITSQRTHKACTCGCSSSGSDLSKQSKVMQPLVFAIGRLSVDALSEANRDSLLQHMDKGSEALETKNLLQYLDANPWEAASIAWTLNYESTPVYAIKPLPPFSEEGYLRLRQCLRDQIAGKVERISLPGTICDSVRLLSGETVPVVAPSLRGLYSWNTEALIDALSSLDQTNAKPEEPKAPANEAQKAKYQASMIAYQAELSRYNSRLQPLRNFLERVYFESQNLGITSEQRAINYAATNAMNVAKVFQAAIEQEMELDEIKAEQSRVCRPQSDCWDVKLVFFHPLKRIERARKAYRFSVDVSQVVPVMVGPVRSWYVA